jgi:hypothetical protein
VHVHDPGRSPCTTSAKPFTLTISIFKRRRARAARMHTLQQELLSKKLRELAEEQTNAAAEL